MAAAADRPEGDVLECVSPELALVDTALWTELRGRLAPPDDTLARLARLRSERPSVEPVRAVRADERPRVQPQPSEIDDLIVFPGDAATHESAPVVSAPSPALLAAVDSGIEDLLVERRDDASESEEPSRMYPKLPEPPAADDHEDATELVLRRIREHFEVESSTRTTRRLLTVVATAAALCATAIFAADVRLGLYELPSWFAPW